MRLALGVRRGLFDGLLLFFLIVGGGGFVLTTTLDLMHDYNVQAQVTKLSL